MDKPLVTIITPTYNAARWLPETINSVLTQDYPHLEYLILDDGSTDGTREVLDRFQSDNRVRVFRHPNMGEVKTINRGFDISHGLLIGNLSADDPLWSARAISRMVETLEQNPDIMVVYPDFFLIDEKGSIIQTILTREWDYEYMVSHHHCTPGAGALMRRKALSLVGYRNSDPGLRWVADLEYWLRLGLVGKMQRVPLCLATHRRHPEQLTLKMRGRAMAEQHIRLYEQYFLGLDNCPCQENLQLCHHHDNLFALKPQAMAYTYLTCAYVSPGDYVSMTKYLAMAIRSWPPIIKDIGPLVLSKGVQLFSHIKGS